MDSVSWLLLDSRSFLPWMFLPKLLFKVAFIREQAEAKKSCLALPRALNSRNSMGDLILITVLVN